MAEACGQLGVDRGAHSAHLKNLEVPGAVIRYDKRNRPYNANAGPIRNAEMVAAGGGHALRLPPRAIA